MIWSSISRTQKLIRLSCLAEFFWLRFTLTHRIAHRQWQRLRKPNPNPVIFFVKVLQLLLLCSGRFNYNRISHALFQE
ncbi:hypothetical protein L2E82_47803 [Cichorium intybus]|uniref:Uncharacterized protein n=1 Tax=Cichorium intybus TaxID=13427 RepID=A0ACB8YWR2_CICIN|nr:hypothetical protein L2E82_47803 [Cichorium intybus]